MTGKTSNNQENTRELALRVAIEEETRKKTDPNESHEKSLIIVGSREVGKTTMIYRFLEKEDAPKATLAMDYSYGRKAGKSLVKDVVHVWEIGHLDSSLVAGAMTGCALSHAPQHTTILIMLDLSKPELLWTSLVESIATLRSAMEKSYTQELIQEMFEHKLKVLRERSKSNENPPTDVFPMRLCIIGGKYDEFKDTDGYDREFIGQVLRAAAHTLGAGLHYHSAKDSHLLRKTKELLSHYGFKGQATKGSSVTDYDKPLSVAAGSDSFAAIELHQLQPDLSSAAATLKAIGRIYVAKFPQGSMDPVGGAKDEDLADDPNFTEVIVDRLREQREQEISVLLRDMLEAPATNIPIPEPY